MTEIETVTVTAAEFKERMDHYLALKETTRIVVLHREEPMIAIGPWLPGERRTLPPRWFWDEIFPRQPIDHTNRASRAILEDRGVIPRST
jgi:hypothetical protein